VKYAVPAGDGVSIDKANEVILVRYQGQVFGFNLACPHENYALRWREKDVRFQCPEHQSRYQPDGTFVDGRATRNMDRFAIRHEGGDVVVDIDLLYRSDKQPNEWKAAVVRL
jgi:nitrite reductase/ring-hydroxylating ferredoxin subunit